MSFALRVCLSNTGRDHRAASDLYNINTCPRKERLSYESIRQNLFHTDGVQLLRGTVLFKS